MAGLKLWASLRRELRSCWNPWSSGGEACWTPGGPLLTTGPDPAGLAPCCCSCQTLVLIRSSRSHNCNWMTCSWRDIMTLHSGLRTLFVGFFGGGLFWVSGWRIFHCTLCGVLLLVDAALCCIAGTLHFADKHMQCNYNALQPCPKTCTQCELQLYCYCIEYCVFLFEMQCHCCCSDFSQRNNKKTKHGLTVQKKCLFPTMDDCACVCVCVPCLSWNCGCVVPG